MKRLAAAAGVVLALASCDRKPRLVPAGADSTVAIPADSTAIYVQIARERWQTAESSGEAAQITARLLADHMRGHADETLGSAARSFMDSLGMGAEVAGRDPAIVNLFSRSDPTGGSWAFLFWRDGGLVRYQELDANGLHLSGVALEPAAEEGAAQRLAGVFTGSGPSGQQPFAFVWVRAPNATTWRLTQSLGADSLGRTGNARILEGGPGGAVLETRTFTIERGFEECPSCPHVYRVRRLGWDTPGLVTLSSTAERTPYATLVQFIGALGRGDRFAAEGFVADPALLAAADGYGWGVAKGRWRLAPGMTASSNDLLVFRGAQEAYRVRFMPRGEDWLIASLEPSGRSLE